MEMLSKLAVACQACEVEIGSDAEIPAVVHHPEIRVPPPVRDGIKLSMHRQKLEDMEIFHAQMNGGKTIPLLKTMLTTYCENNCYYCAFRKDRNYQRVGFSPEEMAGIFIQIYRKGLVKGLFLSSGVAGNAIRSQDRLLDCVSILRKKYAFHGYIHLKLLPGAQDAQISEAVKLASRVSINIEGPNEGVLAKLAPQKRFVKDLIGGLDSVYRITEAEQGGLDPSWLKTSLTTQLVMGAAGESDREILKTTNYLYNKLKLSRVYYSAFSPTSDTPFDSRPSLPHLRHARMYQASFLLRDYNFDYEELPFEHDGNLVTDVDPKLAWARINLAEQPLDINRVDFQQLIRIPGIGKNSAHKILNERGINGIRKSHDLKRLGISLKRCSPFILIQGKQPEFQPELW